MMLDFLRRNRVLVAALVAFGVAAVLIASTAIGHGRTDAVGRLLLNVMAPFQRLGAGLSHELERAWGGAATLFRRRAEVDALQRHLVTLAARSVRLDEVEQENERLRALLEFRGRLAGEVIAAAVIGRDATGLARTLTIGKGERDGVIKGAAVLAPAGVVGQVFLVGATTARVLLITDHNSGLDAIVQRTRARGIIEGAVAEGCALKYVKRTEDLVAGDVIVTSGVDGIFPRGLPVGRIDVVDKRGQGLFQDATVTPFVDFERLEEVLVAKGVVGAIVGDEHMSTPVD
jgi:rod shape-determining protein MreC